MFSSQSFPEGSLGLSILLIPKPSFACCQSQTWPQDSLEEKKIIYIIPFLIGCIPTSSHQQGQLSFCLAERTKQEVSEKDLPESAQFSNKQPDSKHIKLFWPHSSRFPLLLSFILRFRDVKATISCGWYTKRPRTKSNTQIVVGHILGSE